MQLSHRKNRFPMWLKYSIAVYALSAIPWWLMLRPGSADSAWVYLVMLTPALAALLFGLLKKHRLKCIACWLGDMRFWLAALSLPLLVEALTVMVAMFLQLGDFNSTIFNIGPRQAINEAIRLPFRITAGSPVGAIFHLLVSGAVAAALNFPFAVAEELGWRGTLHLQCTAQFGFLKGAVLVGLVWGVWQVPNMIAN